MAAPDWQRLIDGLRDGDERVAAEFYGRFRPLLERLAASNLQSGLLRRVGPDEIAHSACRTFLRRIHDGQFEIEGGDRLWNLLCAITLHKTRKQARRHLADKRGVDREVDAGDDAPPAAGEPTPAEAAEFTDRFRHVMESFDDEERRIVALKLERRDNHEIAAACGLSERTVRRVLNRIESRLVAGLTGD